MLLKIGAIAALVVIGFAVGGHRTGAIDSRCSENPFSFDVLKSIGAAMVPIAFAYGGWQTATFVAAEIRDPRRDLSRGLLLGVAGVVALYLAVNLACLRVLGPAGLDVTTTPASDLMRIALGESGRSLDRARDHNFCSRFPQPKHAHCSASVLRDGA